jgi:hypothetical protein
MWRRVSRYAKVQDYSALTTTHTQAHGRQYMSRLPSKTSTRIANGMKRFVPILEAARARDINESDTVVIVTDVLSDVLGYDKYSEITSEHSIRGTYCDLAIKLDGRLSLLIEVKAIGMDLKDSHVKQAVDYAANEGCDWVILTNGIVWQVRRISFEKPIRADLVLDLNLIELSTKRPNDIQMLWLLSREGIQKAGLASYHAQREALSRFTLAALLQAPPVLEVLRRELRRVSPDAKIQTSEIQDVLLNEVLKRDVLEGDQAKSAKRAVSRASSRALRKTSSESTASTGRTPNGASEQGDEAEPHECEKEQRDN